MADKVQLIKEVIERRIESINSCPFRTAELGSEKMEEGELSAYNSILQFIDSIPEEHNEDLEEEIKLWIPAHIEGGDENLREVAIEWSEIVARHFAEWQKQQMMKDTIEGTVKYEIGSAEIPQCDRRYQVLSDATPIANAKLGGKVKIVVLKTE